jgi:hypothetical protein
MHLNIVYESARKPSSLSAGIHPKNFCAEMVMSSQLFQNKNHQLLNNCSDLDNPNRVVNPQNVTLNGLG